MGRKMQDIFAYFSTLNAYEAGTASKFRNVGTKSSDPGRLPKRHNTAFNTRRKFAIKTNVILGCLHHKI